MKKRSRGIAREGSEMANQPPPLHGYDVFGSDRVLVEAVARAGADWALPSLHALGSLAGSSDAIALGFDANRFAPILHTHDRSGERIDEVEFHPAWHRLMTVAVQHGLHASPWRDPRPGAHAARAAGFFTWTQVEAGHGCPISMTYAALPVLRGNEAAAVRWTPALSSYDYDFGLRPVADKRGALCGMGMTEKQGGSDVRANETRAERLDAQTYAITGHKWFCSAPMCDAFLILAQAPEGLTCFLLPRVLPDGTRNDFRIQRLKDKLGNRSNASSEVEFAGALAAPIGELGRGVQTIIEMVNATRLDCVIGSAAGMRQALVQAIHHARHRSAFGKRLIDQPLMRAVLADLALESEAATTLAMRLAQAADASRTDADAQVFRRIATAIGKFWVCKRAAGHAAEALECLGGNGYVEESIAPRLYREAPLNSIWEGSGNVNALDVLRAMRKTPATLEAVRAEIAPALHADATLAQAARDLDVRLREDGENESQARVLVEGLALVLQAALLVRHAPTLVADAFIAGRLGPRRGAAYGALPAGIDTAAIIERALPPLS
jgi:putative acyl-CoA dehydrogenase